MRAKKNEVVYRVYKFGGNHCIRKFESLMQAKAWCWLKESKMGYRIEWQYPDESTPRSTFV